MEPVVPGIFHIHVDGKEVSGETMRRLVDELNFFESNFSGSPEGYKSFYPKIHLTWKNRERSFYEEKWDETVRLMDSNGFKGYLEGEFIPIDHLFDDQDYDDSIPFPFKVTTRKLNPEQSEFFRETEFHLSMDKKKSDGRLIKKLLESGMIPVEIDKGDRGEFIIFTSQGYKDDIALLIRKLRDYLRKAGGAVNCTLKEEEVENYKLYKIDESDLPEIVDQIELS